MTIHLNVNSELERRLKKVASQMGLTPDTYIMRLLQKELESQTAPARLSPEESKLLKKINSSLTAIEWGRYQLLLAKRDSETLSADERADAHSTIHDDPLCVLQVSSSYQLQDW